MNELYVLKGIIYCFEGNNIEEILGIFKTKSDCIKFKNSNNEYENYEIYKFDYNGTYFEFN